MPDDHDFKRFPELSNAQLQTHYFDSPHRQITEEFDATVIGVHDGDTIRVEWGERDFNFPIRFANLAAPELDETGGEASQQWLEGEILDKEVTIVPTKTRVEKWGRLLAFVISEGRNMTEESIRQGHGISWDQRRDSPLPDFEKELTRFDE